MTYAVCWLFLLASILLAVLGLSLFKGMDRVSPWIGLFSLYILFIIAYYFRVKAIVQIPVVVAYAVWEAVGLVLVILIVRKVLAHRVLWVWHCFWPVHIWFTAVLKKGKRIPDLPEVKYDFLAGLDLSVAGYFGGML